MLPPLSAPSQLAADHLSQPGQLALDRRGNAGELLADAGQIIGDHIAGRPAQRRQVFGGELADILGGLPGRLAQIVGAVTHGREN